MAYVIAIVDLMRLSHRRSGRLLRVSISTYTPVIDALALTYFSVSTGPVRLSRCPRLHYHDACKTRGDLLRGVTCYYFIGGNKAGGSKTAKQTIAVTHPRWLNLTKKPGNRAERQVCKELGITTAVQPTIQELSCLPALLRTRLQQVFIGLAEGFERRTSGDGVDMNERGGRHSGWK